MPSPIRRIVEPAFGWLFVVAVAIVLCAALLAAARPTQQAAAPGRVHAEKVR